MILWSCSSRSWNNWVFTSEFPVSLGNDGSFCTDYILKIGKCEMGLEYYTSKIIALWLTTLARISSK